MRSSRRTGSRVERNANVDLHFSKTRAVCFNVFMTSAEPKPADFISAIDALASRSSSAEELMTAIVALLHEKLPKYNWAGFYMLEKDAAPPMLVLGPFRGAATPHTRIPLGQGICGAAAASGETVVVEDVNSDARYLACSLETKSEIVVPIFVNGKVAGELDIDSHAPAAFGAEDRKLCEHAARVVGNWLERLR
jgi:L-methionine (R)-S-oxide reductase